MRLVRILSRKGGGLVRISFRKGDFSKFLQEWARLVRLPLGRGEIEFFLKVVDLLESFSRGVELVKPPSAGGGISQSVFTYGD